METVIVELTDPKAYRLLQYMEELNFIHVRREHLQLSALRKKIKAKMKGKDIDRQLNSLREEWQRNI
jgi:hypothetical protein